MEEMVTVYSVCGADRSPGLDLDDVIHDTVSQWRHQEGQQNLILHVRLQKLSNAALDDFLRRAYNRVR